MRHLLNSARGTRTIIAGVAFLIFFVAICYFFVRQHNRRQEILAESYDWFLKRAVLKGDPVTSIGLFEIFGGPHDNLLIHLARYPEVTSLEICYIDFTDNGLKPIQSLHKLKTLSFLVSMFPTVGWQMSEPCKMWKN